MINKEIENKIIDILNKMRADGVYDRSDALEMKFTTQTTTATGSIDAQKKDGKFSLSGEQIVNGHFASYVGCVGLTKAFLYAARDSGLELRAVITTRTDDLEKGNNGHVVPAVKMHDGKFHMFDPRPNPKRDGFQFLTQTAEVGKTCTHDALKLDGEYKIMEILMPDELETITTQTAIQTHSKQTPQTKQTTIIFKNNQRE